MFLTLWIGFSHISIINWGNRDENATNQFWNWSRKTFSFNPSSLVTSSGNVQKSRTSFILFLMFQAIWRTSPLFGNLQEKALKLSFQSKAYEYETITFCASNRILSINFPFKDKREKGNQNAKHFLEKSHDSTLDMLLRKYVLSHDIRIQQGRRKNSSWRWKRYFLRQKKKRRVANFHSYALFPLIAGNYQDSLFLLRRNDIEFVVVVFWEETARRRLEGKESNLNIAESRRHSRRNNGRSFCNGILKQVGMEQAEILNSIRQGLAVLPFHCVYFKIPKNFWYLLLFLHSLENISSVNRHVGACKR